MEMTDILSKRQSRKSVSRRDVRSVSCENTNDANTIGFGGIEDGASANAVDGDAVYQIGLSVFSSRANTAAEKAGRERLDAGESEPTDLDACGENVTRWEEWYRALWKVKMLRGREYHG